MATANRKKLHKHFIRGRDPMAPVGDGAPNLPQQVKAGQIGSWEGGGERRERETEREREVEIMLWDRVRGRECRERESISLLSLLFIQTVFSL